MIFPDWATKVTPYSKAIAMTMMAGLPFLGFWAGINYQKKVTIYPIPVNDIRIISERDTAENLLFRCGDFPEKIFADRIAMYLLEGISWSRDCKFAAWSQRRSPRGQGYTEDIGYIVADKTDEGLWIYDDRTGKINKLISVRDGDTLIFKEWAGNNKLVYQTGGNTLVYDMESKKVSEYE